MTERLAISRIGHRGDGVADGPEGSVFVSYTLPGETVEVEPRLKHLIHFLMAEIGRRRKDQSA